MKMDELRILLDGHQAEVFRFVRFLGVQQADAEDIVQETFLAAFTGSRGPAIDDRAGWGRWLRGIARNMVQRLWRNHTRDERGTRLAGLQEAERFWESEMAADPQGSLHAEALKLCMGKLTDRDRQVIDLRYRAAESRDRIGDLIGMSEHGVKTLLRKIRHMLAECIRVRMASGNTI